MTWKNGGYRCKTETEKRRMEEEEVRLALRNKNNRNPEQSLLRRHDKKSTVSDLVYKYLSKVAYTNSVRRQRNNACNKFRRRYARKRLIHHPRKYTNAGNRIESYIRNALSIAVDSGYLIPTGRDGKFLRLSPDLALHHTINNE